MVLDEIARFFTEIAETIYGQRRPAPDLILEHAHAFADAVGAHPDHTRVLLEWSTGLRQEVSPLFLKFQEKVVAMIARTIERWRMETGNQRDFDAEDDARLIAATGHVLLRMKMANVPALRIERFLETPGARHPG